MIDHFIKPKISEEKSISDILQKFQKAISRGEEALLDSILSDSIQVETRSVKSLGKEEYLRKIGKASRNLIFYGLFETLIKIKGNSSQATCLAQWWTLKRSSLWTEQLKFFLIKENNFWKITKISSYNGFNLEKLDFSSLTEKP